uniref:Periviscerokinin-2 n=2 Tax=Acrididae TaxID=7002 RepID=PVK2_SCHGR|nr:RecName: Full=Periviscerokinin-2; AltName: Full=Lom-PVK-2 [Schistocerca gregaria]P85865.1 RecName: Full=Periviscerokinin-2; AltName: Full=Lom-PVK-2 [Locusta migratoria]
GLLAFPRV